MSVAFKAKDQHSPRLLDLEALVRVFSKVTLEAAGRVACRFDPDFS